METLLLLVISLIRSGVSITGYDCGGKQWKSQLTYSSTEVEPCPKVTSWFQSELPVNTQVMRIPKKNRVNATICEVTVSHRAHWCGFDSILHGTEIQLDHGVHIDLTQSDCEDLVYRHQLNYLGETWTDNRTHFTVETVSQGWRDAANGRCKPSSRPFSKNGRKFPNHILRDVITVNLRQHEFEYLLSDQAFKVDNNLVDVRDEYYKSKFVYVWKDPTRDCEDGGYMKEIYSGAGKLLKPSNAKLPTMLLVNSPETSQMFGLELGKSTTSKCGWEMYPTNLLDVFITYNNTWMNSGRGWEVPGLDDTDLRDADRIQNIKARGGYNFASTSHRLTHATAELAKQTCENRRQVTLTNLAIMRHNPEEGSYLLFGRGYNALVRGSSFLLYKCEEKEFEYRSVTEDFQDIPVKWSVNGTYYEGFLDSVTYKLKTNSYNYENYGQLPVEYNLDGDWRCKQNSLIRCSPPKVLSHNFEVDKLELNIGAGKKQRVKYDGGLQDIKTRKEFEAAANERQDVRANFDGIMQDITDHVDEDQIYDKLHLQAADEQVAKTSFYANSLWLGLKVGAIASGIIGVYLSYCRYMRWKKADKSFKEDRYNLFNVCCHPSQFFASLNIHHHDALEDELEEILVLVNDKSPVVEAPPRTGEIDPSLPPSRQIQRLSGAYYQFPDQPCPPAPP